jgi:hypothetical protein
VRALLVFVRGLFVCCLTDANMIGVALLCTALRGSQRHDRGGCPLSSGDHTQHNEIDCG